MTNALLDLTGQTFGIWEVIEQAPRRDNKTRWLCRCTTCGAVVSHRSSALRKGAFTKCYGTHKRRAGVPSPLRKPNGYAAGTEMFGHYRRQAQRRGLAFTLTRPEFDELTAQDCHYCASPPSNRHTRRHYSGVFVYSGIDRRDSTRGYEVDNCLPCCATCNVMKQDLPYEVFLAHIRRIAELHLGAATAAPVGMALGNGGNTRPANLEVTS